MTTESHHNSFAARHLGPRPTDVDGMLQMIGLSSMEKLLDEAIPSAIRLEEPLDLPVPVSERAFLDHADALSRKNRPGTCLIGQGYYGTLTPPVIQRNLFENPGWYTPYTPYQAEIAQGRLESLLNFQTMVCDLTGMEAANASLLDEATAAAEAMTMMHRLVNRRKNDKPVLAVSSSCFEQTLEVVRGRAIPLEIELQAVDPGDPVPDRCFGALFQTPGADGELQNLTSTIEAYHEQGALVAVATDLLALALITPPGECGADIVLGSAQRFGVPMMYGGPHAAFFAAREKMVREMPGRIIGVSKDRDGRRAYRMSLQTREQHIRREKAKSNICTAQALLANAAAMYAVYHGPDGIRSIAHSIHTKAGRVAASAASLGIKRTQESFFDTLTFIVDPESVRAVAEPRGIHFFYVSDGVRISLDETHTEDDLQAVCDILAEAQETSPGPVSTDAVSGLPDGVARTTTFLEHPVFNQYHSETEMMRYMRHLERKDLGLDAAMIPLGSCTMKLNAAAEMMPITWPGYAHMHPMLPDECAGGYLELIEELSGWLARITGFAGVSMQPNSGAQGELAGLLVIRAWHQDRGDTQRTVMLIPSSAHGTNPASAVMAGMDVSVVACDESGNVDMEDLARKMDAAGDRLAGLMITYPSTHGVFEDTIQEICRQIHDAGGRVYMDGANLNAQVGLTHPAKIGADVCHLNLHKTFSIPHGGGGPGMGPIAVTEDLIPYLPGHPARLSPKQAIPALSAAPYGSAAILLISYGYIRMLGEGGCRASTEYAILNANYIRSRLGESYSVLYTNANGRVAHELIIDLRPFKDSAGVTEEDVAKRLMDYSFHAPTVSWPVPGTLMVEPTESESLQELDRFCDAMLSIREEIREIEEGRADRENNLLKGAPHPVETVISDSWDRGYPRSRAAYPVPGLRDRKTWPTISRIDNTYGDRNLVCSCPPLENYEDGGDS